MESKTKQAIRWLNESPERTQYAAAKIFNISQSAICVALQKQAKNIQLWKTHGANIEHKEVTGDHSCVAHIPATEYINAIRGRDVLRLLAGRASCHPEYAVTKCDDALDWLDVNGGTIKDAALRAGVSIPAVYAGRRVRDTRAQALDLVDVQRVAKYIEGNPTKSTAEVAEYFGVSIATLRDAMTARATNLRCEAIGRAPSERQKALEEAALIAESIGGEYGGYVAAAIRGLSC